MSGEHEGPGTLAVSTKNSDSVKVGGGGAEVEREMELKASGMVMHPCIYKLSPCDPLHQRHLFLVCLAIHFFL